MSGFAHAMAGGQGNLVIASFQSPQFVTGVSGWQVTKAGNAEFNNVVTRGEFGGANYIIDNDGIFFYG